MQMKQILDIQYIKNSLNPLKHKQCDKKKTNNNFTINQL